MGGAYRLLKVKHAPVCDGKVVTHGLQQELREGEVHTGGLDDLRLGITQGKVHGNGAL